MLEHPDMGAAEPGTKTNRGMIELVGDDEGAFADESRDDGGVGGETHGADEGVLSADKHGDEGLADDMEIIGTACEPGATGGNAVAVDGVLDGIGATATGLGKTEVVVGGDVEGTGAGACEDLGVVVIGGDVVEKKDGAAGDACDGMGEAFVKAGFKAASVEGIKVGVERGITLWRKNEKTKEREREGDTHVFGSEMDVERWVETLSNKVTNVAQTDEDEIADVGGK